MTEKIRRKPYSVVLFDEIEKAHPDVFNMLLQILEDGILTDAQGRRVDFKNTIIIMTSNVGARMITEKRSFGFASAIEDDGVGDQKRIRDDVLSELKKAFRPEFLNRVDDIIVFQQLTHKDIQEIARRMMHSLGKRLADMDMSIEVSDRAVEEISKEGFDPVYGARPLRRAIQAKIEDPLAEQMLEGKFHSGDTVTVDFARQPVFLWQTRINKRISGKGLSLPDIRFSVQYLSGAAEYHQEFRCTVLLSFILCAYQDPSKSLPAFAA